MAVVVPGCRIRVQNRNSGAVRMARLRDSLFIYYKDLLGDDSFARSRTFMSTITLRIHGLHEDNYSAHTGTFMGAITLCMLEEAYRAQVQHGVSS